MVWITGGVLAVVVLAALARDWTRGGGGASAGREREETLEREFDVQTDQGLGITGRNICVLGRGDISVHRDRDRVR